MKIKQFKKLNIASYKNFEWKNTNKDLHDKVNIFLGWNGTGKTILSRILYSLQTGKLHTKLGSGTFIIKCDNKDINEKNFSTFDLSNTIHVFNVDYVSEYLSHSSVLPGIFYIQENAADLAKKERELKNLKDRYYELNCENKHDQLAIDVAAIIRSITGIKDINRELSPNGDYSNYDKRDFKARIKFFKKNSKELNISLSLNEGEISELKGSLARFDTSRREFQKIKQAREFFKNLGDINQVLQSIPDFKKSKRISDVSGNVKKWIETGFELHDFNHTDTKHHKCLFCDSRISDEIKNELIAHFSKSRQILKNKVDNYLTEVNKHLSNLKETFTIHEELREKLFTNLNIVFNKLDSKKKNIDSVYSILDSELTSIFYKEKTETPDDLAYKLERYYVAKNFHKYINYKQNYDQCNEKKNKLIQQIHKCEQELEQLRSKNEGTAKVAEAFTNDLRKMFPMKNIKIEYNSFKKGFNIKRNGVPVSNINDLSEGEKNAIAFLHFIYDLNNSKQKLNNDGIVVIDDPISSMDHHLMFYIYSRIESQIDKKQNRQYIVLTHNLDFFSQFKYRFNKRNKKGHYKAHFYEITYKLGYRSVIKSFDNQSSPIMKYRNDYRYAIQILDNLRTEDIDNEEDKIKAGILTINLMRRVAETFAEFKIGARDLSQNWEKICNNVEDIDSVEAKEMVKFMHYGSHGFDNIDTMNIDLILSYKEKIEKLFTVIKSVDKSHYESFKFE